VGVIRLPYENGFVVRSKSFGTTHGRGKFQGQSEFSMNFYKSYLGIPKSHAKFKA